MNTLIPIALMLSAGLWLVASSFRAQHFIDFSQRIAPQLRAQHIRSHLHTADEENLGLWRGYRELFRPGFEAALERISEKSDAQALEKRLTQAGQGMTVFTFRAEQVLWAFLGFSASLLVMGLGVWQGKVPTAGALLLTLLSGMSGYLARDWWLGQKIVAREKAMLAEFPALAELMALSVTAGESAVDSLERVVRCSRGELAGEFAQILAQTRAGDGLAIALQDFSRRTSLAPISRFVDGIVVAIERGTPLSEVLRAQAQDVRDTAKRDLMETAGKKEIAMMAPIIFFILPLTVVFAVFPGLSLINLNF